MLGTVIVVLLVLGGLGWLAYKFVPGVAPKVDAEEAVLKEQAQAAVDSVKKEINKVSKK
jgi:hypothetical protein